jgi:hypothetical protein
LEILPQPKLPDKGRAKTMKCKVCDIEVSEEGFCELHLKAYRNILMKFEVWKKAFDVTWTQYLVRIQKNSLTGEWAKDVAKYLIEEERKDV